jgi:hypothetical protein
MVIVCVPGIWAGVKRHFETPHGLYLSALILYWTWIYLRSSFAIPASNGFKKFIPWEGIDLKFSWLKEGFTRFSSMLDAVDHGPILLAEGSSRTISEFEPSVGTLTFPEVRLPILTRLSMHS